MKKTVLYLIVFFGVVAMIVSACSNTGNTQSKMDMEKEQPTTYVEEPVTTPAPTAASKPTTKMTISQRNALEKAKQYLDFSAYSYTGLIGQLEYEKFSTEDATFAVDNCNADWNEQAAKKAEQYLDFTSYSREGLIDQLEYEGFTPEQAEYGVTAIGY